MATRMIKTKMKRVDIIIDFEFTGLDNTFIKDNEIIQMKAVNADTGKQYLARYHTKKKVSAYGWIMHGLLKLSNIHRTFSKEEFFKGLSEIGATDPAKVKFWGYGTSQDRLMLMKYGILIGMHDIREELQRTKHEYRLATEGNSLEVAYYIVTGKHPKLHNHNGIEEIILMLELFKQSKRMHKKEFLSIMPHGHCAGMPLEDYVVEYRRAADGYRFNNSDLLAESLSGCIEKYESEYEEDF